MKERNSGLRNKSSKAKRIRLFQRITAALLLPLIIIYKKLSSTFLPNLFLFWHINEGIKDIMEDYVHQEMTRNLILVYLRLFFLIVIKDVFLSLVSFLCNSKHLFYLGGCDLLAVGGRLLCYLFHWEPEKDPTSVTIPIN
ncbi:Uncharacterized mitochondrial protein ymf17 [Linum perenne]